VTGIEFQHVVACYNPFSKKCYFNIIFYEKEGTKHVQNVEDGSNKICWNSYIIILDGEETDINHILVQMLFVANTYNLETPLNLYFFFSLILAF
jgi:hypothetical protein